MDAYDLYWKIKTLWMNNCNVVSGSIKKPEYVKVVVKENDECVDVVDAVYDKEINAVKLILRDKNGN